MVTEAGSITNIKSNAGRVVSTKGMNREFLIVLVLTAIHLPLGVALQYAGSIAIVHPILVFALGLYLAIRRKARHADVALVIGYIIGSEIMWRMAQVPIYWEFGKYAPIAIITVAMIRRRRFAIPKLPLLYFALLVPACIITVASSTLARAEGTLSFTMSGPLLLFFSCWFFYNANISPLQFRRLLISIVIPLLSVGMIALFSTVTTENLSFTEESNLATSGGFGPNQVSAMLGLGVFISVGGFTLLRKGVGYRLFFAISALLFAPLCVMTFSRGGIYNAIGGIIVLLIFGFKEFVVGLKRLGLALIFTTVFIFLIFPALNSFTGGALQSRFEDTGTTHRSEIAESDLEMFFEDPLFGVGVGASYRYREKFLEFKAVSHTEFSRMISEHGLFGVGALILMVWMAVSNIRRPNSRPGKAFIAAAYTWSFLFMLNAGMRLAAPAFLWGLGFVTIVSLRESIPLIMRRTKVRQPIRFRPDEGAVPVKS